MRWKHSPVIVIQRGRMKVACICGEQSKWLDDHDEAAKWYSDHSGLKEKPRKGRQ